jgi:hypothetical protein
VLAFGSLLGLVGVLVAVPVAAAIAVLVRFALGLYLESPIYRGNEPPMLPPAGGSTSGGPMPSGPMPSGPMPSGPM